MNQQDNESMKQVPETMLNRDESRTSLKYVIKKRCFQKINSFYRNVSIKYKHTYSEELMHKNADDAFDSIYKIERTLLRRSPTIARWAGYHMAHTEKWYFAYIIKGDTIIVVDACHAQNMK